MTEMAREEMGAMSSELGTVAEGLAWESFVRGPGSSPSARDDTFCHTPHSPPIGAVTLW